MKFQSFMDISTDVDSMKIITISAGGENVLKRLAPQFGAYKYYKLGNISVKLVPASTLPVDPTGLSIDPNTDEYATVDPRDQLTPGLMRITNGEDIFENITGLTDEQQHAIYNNMLLDPRWYKWMLQSGVKRHATPRFWQIGQLHQDKWPGSIVNFPYFVSAGAETVANTAHQDVWGYSNNPVVTDNVARVGSSPYGLFQTGHSGRIGWLPTDGLQNIDRSSSQGGSVQQPFITSPVEVECFKLILPKAYKTRYWYRMFISETVFFKEPIVNFGIVNPDTGNGYRPLDVFHIPSTPVPVLPTIPQEPAIYDSTTGGNYGDD